MARKKKPKASAGSHSKLIVPGAQPGSKSQLLVPGGSVGTSSARLSVPGESPAADEQPAPVDGGADQDAAAAPDQFTVINEDAHEQAAFEEPAQAPVKVTAMVPPTPEPELEEYEQVVPQEDVYVEPVAPVAMEAPVEEAYAEEAYTEEIPQAQYAEEEVAYEAPPEEYAQPADGEWEQPQEQYAQEEYYDPAQYAEPVAPAPPAPTLAPPQYQQPAQAPPPYGYGPPPGYHAPPQGMAPAPMYPGNQFQPARNVPSWALILVGTLVGFLAAMVIFKFTGMGAALRGDLIKEGVKMGADRQDKYWKQKEKQWLEDGYGEEDAEEPAAKDEAAADPGEDDAEPAPEPASEPEPEPAGEDVEENASASPPAPQPGVGEATVSFNADLSKADKAEEADGDEPEG